MLDLFAVKAIFKCGTGKAREIIKAVNKTAGRTVLAGKCFKSDFVAWYWKDVGVENVPEEQRYECLKELR